MDWTDEQVARELWHEFSPSEPYSGLHDDVKRALQGQVSGVRAALERLEAKSYSSAVPSWVEHNTYDTAKFAEALAKLPVGLPRGGDVSAGEREATLKEVAQWLRGEGCEMTADDLLRALNVRAAGAGSAEPEIDRIVTPGRVIIRGEDDIVFEGFTLRAPLSPETLSACLEWAHDILSRKLAAVRGPPAPEAVK